jgi:hypothetical protein
MIPPPRLYTLAAFVAILPILAQCKVDKGVLEVDDVSSCCVGVNYTNIHTGCAKAIWNLQGYPLCDFIIQKAE